MEDLKIDGLGVALITPFNKNNTVDFDALGSIIDDSLDARVDYLIVTGTTAETPTLSSEEKKNISEFVKNKVNGKIPLVRGIGGNNTMEVARELSTTDLDGFSAVLSVTPFYSKPSQEGLFLHFKTLANASPLPLILYNVPGRTGVNLSTSTVLRLAKECPGIMAIKESSGNMRQCEEIAKTTPEGFYLISGDDANTTTLMEYGAIGVISVLANAFPAIMKSIVTHCKEGNFEDAKRLQDLIAPVNKYLFEDGNPAGIKSLLYSLGKIENRLRLPLVSASPEVELKLAKEIPHLKNLTANL